VPTLHAGAEQTDMIEASAKKKRLYQFLPRDASAERGYATISCPSVRLSVCPSVCP